MLSRLLIRAVVGTTVRKTQFFNKIPIYAFNTVQSTPPGKKILDVWDLNKGLYMELSDALGGAYTCKQLAELLKENVSQMTDYQLSYALYRIFNDDIPLDDHFYNVILPIVKEFVKNFDRNHNKSLYELIQHCGYLKVQDADLWKLFEEKLLNQKLYRYIPTNELVKCAHALSEANQGSKELFNTFERVLIKHRLNLLPEDIELARDAFQRRHFESKLLLDVLENPTKEFPELAKQETKRIH